MEDSAGNPYMQLAERVALHSVCFAREQAADALISGSGTLVRYGSVRGIVSCAHVINNITATAGMKPSDKIAILRKTASDSLVQRPVVELLDLASCPKIICGNQYRKEGPDLAFLCLSNEIIDELGANAAFLDFNWQYELHGKPFPADSAELMRVAIGSIAEWKDDTVQTIAGPLVTNASIVLPGRYIEQKARGVDDRFRFEPDGMTRLPTTYGGLSGGGLWSVFFKSDPASELKIVQSRFTGIVYYQSRDDGEGTPFHLVGHGSSSIYDYLIPKIATLEARLGADASKWLAARD